MWIVEVGVVLLSRIYEAIENVKNCTRKKANKFYVSALLPQKCIKNFNYVESVPNFQIGVFVERRVS